MNVAAAATDAGAQPVSSLPAVGPALAALLHKLGLERVQDLWFHLPLRYEDRTRVTAIADLRPGQSAQVVGTVEAVERGFRYRPQLKVALGDESCQTLQLRFFHFNRAQAEQLAPGARLVCFGEVRHTAQGLEMVHPQYRRLGAGEAVGVEERLSPVYPTTEGLGQKRLAGVIAKALALLPPEPALELIPPDLCAAHGLASLREALLTVHRPPPDARLDLLLQGRHPAQQRLAFEELLTQHLSLKRTRAAMQRRRAPSLAVAGALRRQLLAALPFALTAAQQRVDAEVRRDLAQAQPMLRLVQGDVGSGMLRCATVRSSVWIWKGPHLRRFRGKMYQGCLPLTLGVSLFRCRRD